MTTSYAGGAPIIADTPALDLANTHYAVRTHVFDGIGSSEDLAGWIGEVGPRAIATDASGLAGAAEVTDAEVVAFAGLRAAIRSTARALVDGNVPATADVTTINQAAKGARGWRELSLGDGEPRLVSHKRSDADGTRRVLAALADDAIDLFAGDRLGMLRACQGPNCTLFFLKDHSRREWCSFACGARARAARAYRRRTGRAE
jgi:predicted RNA-binding Zn ribbon-like protein